NKHRLHNAFSHCKTKPGFYFTIILSPKKDTRNTSDRHCHIYHIINTTLSGVKFNLNLMPE
ncbi:uncharacterized protein HD556DRAFT_1234619, partial [Suillus plorans]